MRHALIVVCALAALCCTVTTGRADPAGEYTALSLLEGGQNAGAIPGSAAATDEVERAAAWLAAVDKWSEFEAGDLADDLALEEDALAFAESKADKKIVKRRIAALQDEIGRHESFRSRFRKLSAAIANVQSVTDERTFVKLLGKAAKKGTHPTLLHYTETASAWRELVDGLDDAVASFTDRIDMQEQRLANAAGAADTKAGKRALELIAAFDRLAETGADARTEIELAVARTFASPYSAAPSQADSAAAKRAKRGLKIYGKFAFAAESIARQLKERVDQALDAVGGPGDPSDDCTPTFPDSPGTGGGFIEVAVGGGGTRRYPAIVTYEIGDRVMLGGYADGAGFPEDFVNLGFGVTPDSGPGTYPVLLDGEQSSPDKVRVTYDTRGPDGDPYPDDNFSFSDWERDILSGTATIEVVDLGKTNRRFKGQIVVETAFLGNPEGLQGEATLTITFDVCGFTVYREDGTPDEPE